MHRIDTDNCKQTHTSDSITASTVPPRPAETKLIVKLLLEDNNCVLSWQLLAQKFDQIKNSILGRGDSYEPHNSIMTSLYTAYGSREKNNYFLVVDHL